MLSSLNPDNKMHGNGKGDVEFDFWGTSKTQYYSDRGGGSEVVGFQAQFEEDFDNYSPPLWETDESRNVRNESSPLLPRSHQYCNISSRSRLQVMVEGRRKLMEMVQSMPESSYELSLKDIVDEQQINSEEAQKEMAMKRTGSDSKSEAQTAKKQKTKKTKSFNKSGNNISRSASMEKETFLIKMFIPTSLSFKIRSDKISNDSKVPPRSSMEVNDKRGNKEWWIKRILFSGEGKKSGGSSSRSTSCSSSRSTNRHDDDNMDALPTCWPSCCTDKNKRTRRKERIF